MGRFLTSAKLTLQLISKLVVFWLLAQAAIFFWTGVPPDLFSVAMATVLHLKVIPWFVRLVDGSRHFGYGRLPGGFNSIWGLLSSRSKAQRLTSGSRDCFRAGSHLAPYIEREFSCYGRVFRRVRCRHCNARTFATPPSTF